MNTENQKKNVSGGRIAIYILFTLIMLLIACIMTAVFTVKAAVTRDNIYDIINNTEYMTIKAEDVDGYEVTLYEMMCNQFKTNKLDRGSFYEIISQTNIESIAADYVYSYAAFVLYGDALDELTPKAVINLYNKNIPKIEQGLGKTLIEKDIQNVENEINNQKELFDNISEDGIKNTLGGFLGVIRFVFSDIGIIIISAFAVILIVLCSIAAKNAYIPTRITGIILLSVSVPSIAMLILIISGHFIVDISSLSAASIIFQSASGVLVPQCLKIMEYLMSAGVILTLVSVIIKSVTKNNAESTAPSAL